MVHVSQATGTFRHRTQICNASLVDGAIELLAQFYTKKVKHLQLDFEPAGIAVIGLKLR